MELRQDALPGKRRLIATGLHIVARLNKIK
jgi:hypothetical protein